MNYILKIFLRGAITLMLFCAAVFATAAGGRFAVEMFSNCTLELQNLPTGAQVHIDGGLILSPNNQTVRTYTLRRGEHLLEISAPGYEPYHNVINTTGKNVLPVEMTKRKMVTFDIASTPQGAYVIINGMIRGRTPLKTILPAQPGYSVELSMANYFPEKETVTTNNRETIQLSYTMKNRQETAYRKRIERDPLDIEAYNDLGELLFVQGRYEDSADIFVKGLLIVDNIQSPSTNQRHNINKLMREARNKHNDSKGMFRKLFDEKLFTALEAGNTNNAPIQQLTRFARKPKYLERYRKLLIKLSKEKSPSPDILFELLKNCPPDDIKRSFDKILKANYSDFEKLQYVTEKASSLWSKQSEQFQQQHKKAREIFYENINKQLKHYYGNKDAIQKTLRSYKGLFPKDYLERMAKSADVVPQSHVASIHARLFVAEQMAKDHKYAAAIKQTEKALANCNKYKNLHNNKTNVELYLKTYRKRLDDQQKKAAEKKKAAAAKKKAAKDKDKSPKE